VAQFLAAAVGVEAGAEAGGEHQALAEVNAPSEVPSTPTQGLKIQSFSP
jgi:hypothetical protein